MWPGQTEKNHQEKGGGEKEPILFLYEFASIIRFLTFEKHERIAQGEENV